MCAGDEGEEIVDEEDDEDDGEDGEGVRKQRQFKTIDHCIYAL